MTLRGLMLESAAARAGATWCSATGCPRMQRRSSTARCAARWTYCDAMAPASHIGSSLVPAAFAAAELAGGCSGASSSAALVVSCRGRRTLQPHRSPMYDGVRSDRRGHRVRRHRGRGAHPAPERDTDLHALGLAFNRCGGSFQSNVDGSLASASIQGWVAQTGIESRRWRYAALPGRATSWAASTVSATFRRGRLRRRSVVDSLGSEWRLNRMMFKKYPSCGATRA